MFKKPSLSLPLRQSDKSDLSFTQLGLGCAPIGNYPTYLSDEQAYKTIKCAMDLGVRVFDTAPLYGYGLSEIRLGEALLKSNITRKNVVISSKVGRILIPDDNSKEHDLFPQSRPFKDVFDYSYGGILNSIQGSLERLKTSYLDIAHVHDLGRFTHGDKHAEMLNVFVSSGYQAMLELRQKGIIKAISLGVNEFEVALELIQKYEIDFDFIMLAQRYTLLEQGEKAKEFFIECEKRGIDVMIGSPLSSGILSDNPNNTAFRYAPASQEILDKKTKIKEICNNNGVALQQAALHFPLLQPAVKTVVMGARSPEEVKQAIQNINKPTLPTLWEDLKKEGLLSIVPSNITEENLIITQPDRRISHTH